MKEEAAETLIQIMCRFQSSQQLSADTAVRFETDLIFLTDQSPTSKVNIENSA